MRKRDKRLQPLERLQSIDYDLTKTTKLMCSDMRLKKACALESREKQRKDYFIPLSPLEMNNISIIPSIFNIGKVSVTDLPKVLLAWNLKNKYVCTKKVNFAA